MAKKVVKKTESKKLYTKKDLEALGGLFEEAEKVAAGGELPDGQYTVRVTEARVENKNRLQAIWKIKVTAGDSDMIGEEGEYAFGLNNEVGLGIYMRGLRKAGCDMPESPQEVVEATESLEGKLLRVQVKSKDGYSNLYVVGAKDDEDEDEEESEEEEEESEEEESEEESEEEESEDDEETEVEFGPGIKVAFKSKSGKDMTGVIEKEGREGVWNVRGDDGKIYSRPVDELELVEDEEEEEEDTETEEEERSLPTQEELDALKDKDVDIQLQELGVTIKELKKKDKLPVLKLLVAEVEGDEVEGGEEVLRAAALGYGLKPKKGAKESEIEDLVRAKLSEAIGGDEEEE